MSAPSSSKQNLQDRLNDKLEQTIDTVSGGFTQIDLLHHLVHEGEMFCYNAINTSLATGATMVVELTTPSTASSDIFVHLITGELDASGPATWYFKEGSTATAASTLASAYNRERNSSTAPTMTVGTDPGTPTGGTTLKSGFVGTSTSRRGTMAGVSGQTLEWLLKPSTKYYLQIANDHTSSIKVSAELNWYEED